MIVVTERQALHNKRNLITKFCLRRTLIKRIRKADVCCHVYRFTMTRMISTTSILFTVSAYLSFNLIVFIISNYLQLCLGNAAIILQNLIFKQQIQKLE